MKVKEFHFQDQIAILGFDIDFTSEEEYGIGDLMKLKKENKLTCEFEEVKIGSKTIPMLVFNREYKQEAAKLNNGEIVNKLKRAKKDFDKFIQANDPSVKKEKQPKIRTFRTDTVILDRNSIGLTSENVFLSSFYYGASLVVCPNPYVLKFNEEEVSLKDFYYGLNKKYKNKEFLNELEKRSVETFKTTKKLIYNIYASINENGYKIGGISGLFSMGIGFYFFPKKDVEIMEKYRFLPYTQNKENGLLTRKSEEEIVQQINESIEYKERLTIQNKKLEEMKDKLKKAGKKWFALDSTSEMTFKNSTQKEWRFWLNPYDQVNHNHGWFSLEELEQWIEDKGPIPKKNNCK